MRERPPAPVRVPEDFCFRECLDVDMGSDADVIEFVRRWGSLSPGEPRPEGASLPHDGAVLQWRAAGYPGTGGWDRSRLARDSLSAQREHLRALRCLAEHFLAFQAWRDVRVPWAAAGFEVPEERHAWTLFEACTDAGLRVFSMRLLLDGREPVAIDRMPSTYEVAVLQLVEAIAEDRTVQLCANERCGRPFTRQRGRARYDRSGHASGVKFCSALCNKAQSERNRRARNRQAKPRGEQSA